ncbi:MAG: alpha/beta hydrolase [Planctomycetes bacterium]|nr:alpha/beta hydrolase [Planctomycetota bacterium]
MSLTIPGPVGPLEAKLARPEGTEPRAVAVFCHPHPLYGGTMNTTAVFRSARGLEEAGLAVLRFNFRGVGKSAGTHDGKGAEELDLKAALDWMAAEFPGKELWAGGFSFGSRTAGSYVTQDARVARLLLVALPVRAFDCSFVRRVRQPGLILMAENDEYGTLRELREKFPDLPPQLETDEIDGTDHYFVKRTQELQARVRRWALESLSRTT